MKVFFFVRGHKFLAFTGVLCVIGFFFLSLSLYLFLCIRTCVRAFSPSPPLLHLPRSLHIKGGDARQLWTWSCRWSFMGVGEETGQLPPLLWLLYLPGCTCWGRGFTWWGFCCIPVVVSVIPHAPPPPPLTCPSSCPPPPDCSLCCTCCGWFSICVKFSLGLFCVCGFLCFLWLVFLGCAVLGLKLWFILGLTCIFVLVWFPPLLLPVYVCGCYCIL